jgi:DNA-binding transcriptional MerR regulator
MRRMRIGELARLVGVSTDTVRFYERAGWLPRASRSENAYRDYDHDVEHLRLLIDLRRLGMPLEEAARVAAWCHSGHCTDSRAALPEMIVERREELRDQIARLYDLDERLGDLERHLRGRRRRLNVIGENAVCCDAALAVISAAEGGCACCATPTADEASALPA